MKKVIVADDHAIVRQGLKRILSCSSGFSVIAEAGTIQDLRTVLKENHADILILDLSMPGGVGMEAIKEIKQYYPKLPILVLSFYGEDQYGLRAFRAGAAGYLNKECAPEQLVSALSEIIEGSRYFSKATMDMIFNQLERKVVSKLPHHDLSDRELHVLTMIGQGISLTQISNDLSLSVKTVSTYRQRVLKKCK